MKSLGALPVFLIGGLLSSSAFSRFIPIVRDTTAPNPECMHVALDEWADASHVAFRQGCGEMVDSLYTASKNNLTIQYVSPNQNKGTVLPQYHSVQKCSIGINSAVSSPTFAAQVDVSEIFEAAYILYNKCVSDVTAPQGSFGGTEYFHDRSLTLTFTYVPTPDLTASTDFFGITTPA